MGSYAQIYELYHHGELVKTGTKQELADYSGLSVSTIYSYASSTCRDIWDVIPIDEFVPKHLVDIERLEVLLAEYGYSKQEVAASLGITGAAIGNKLRKRARFRESELAYIEDLLFLEEGELVIRIPKTRK